MRCFLEAIRDIMEKYKYGGEENLTTEVFMLPNEGMTAKKDAIQTLYPSGLSGFVRSLKESIYTFVGDK